MVKVEVSRFAQDDLKDIFNYSLERWDIDRARAYVDGLLGVVLRLELFPERGPIALGARPGIRRIVHRHHAVFYRIDGETVIVVRIVSSRSLLPAELTDAG